MVASVDIYLYIKNKNNVHNVKGYFQLNDKYKLQNPRLCAIIL